MKHSIWLSILCIGLPTGIALYYFISRLKILITYLIIRIKGRKTIGTVIGFEEWADGEFGPTYAPIVRYRNHEGRLVEATAMFGWSKRTAEVEVCLKYHLARPNTLYVIPALTPIPIILFLFVFVSSVFSFVGLIFFILLLTGDL